VGCYAWGRQRRATSSQVGRAVARMVVSSGGVVGGWCTVGTPMPRGGGMGHYDRISHDTWSEQTSSLENIEFCTKSNSQKYYKIPVVSRPNYLTIISEQR
jgi:hypothetical protein